MVLIVYILICIQVVLIIFTLIILSSTKRIIDEVDALLTSNIENANTLIDVQEVHQRHIDEVSAQIDLITKQLNTVTSRRHMPVV